MFKNFMIAMTLLHENIFDVDLLNQHCFTKELLQSSNYVVFIASTAFTHQMMADLSRTLLDIFDGETGLESKDKLIKTNAVEIIKSNELFVITLSHPLPHQQRFKVFRQELFRMSWGNVMVYFQRMTRPQKTSVK